MKRLSGAKEVSQEDFNSGVATFLVKFDAPPAVSIATVKKEVGKYKVDKIVLRLTGKAVEKDKVWTIGAVSLTGEKSSAVAELKDKLIVVEGPLSEDDKGKQSLEVAKVEEAKKK